MNEAVKEVNENIGELTGADAMAGICFKRVATQWSRHISKWMITSKL